MALQAEVEGLKDALLTAENDVGGCSAKGTESEAAASGCV